MVADFYEGAYGLSSWEPAFGERQRHVRELVCDCYSRRTCSRRSLLKLLPAAPGVSENRLNPNSYSIIIALKLISAELPLFHRKLPRGRPKQGRRRNDKAAEITNAAIRLLAQKDFDRWSMSELARGAGCAVGTLYGRFPDKYACLQYAIDVQFAKLIASISSARSPSPSRETSVRSDAEFLIGHIVSDMTAPSAAGVIRATIKVATIRPEAIKKFEKYRQTVSDCAVALLHTHLAKDVSADSVRLAVQIVIATITDSLLQKKPGPMSAGSSRMKSTLTHVFIGYLGIADDKKWAGTEAENDEGKTDKEVFAQPPDPGNAFYDPKEQGFRRTKRMTTSKIEKSSPSQGRNALGPPPEKAPKAGAGHLPKRSRRKSRTI